MSGITEYSEQIRALLKTKINHSEPRLFFGGIGAVAIVASCASKIFGTATSTQAVSGALFGVTLISGALTGYVALIALPIIIGSGLMIALSPRLPPGSVILIPTNTASNPPFTRNQIPTNPIEPPFRLQPIPIEKPVFQSQPIPNSWYPGKQGSSM